MAAAHANLFPLLSGNPGKAFVKDMTQRIYPWAEFVPSEYYKYRIFTEVTIRKEAGETTRLGLDKKKHFRLDAIFFVQPGMRALNQKQYYTVGMELKNSKSDLMGDKKMEEYIGYTDFFFIGTPADIIDFAIARAGEDSRIGVLDIENGLIIKLPKRLEVSLEHRMEIYEQVLYNTIFNEMGTVMFKTEEVSVALPSSRDDALLEEIRRAKEMALKEQIEERRKLLWLEKEELAMGMAKARAKFPDEISSILERLPLREQRVYCVLYGSAEGMQVKDLIESLPDHSSPATVKRYISDLKDAGLVERVGGKKKGCYRVVEN